MRLVVGSSGDGARAEEASLWCMRTAEGRMAAADQRALEAWLAADGRNRDAFDEALRTWDEVGVAAQSMELVPLRIEALEKLRAARRGRALEFLFAPWFHRTAAAGVVAAVLGAWLLFSPGIYETTVGERRVAVLSDGSRISLDADTRLEVRYDGERRDLRLKHGRAKFDVAKDPLRPFVVAAANRLVVATGTEFSVELLREEVHVVLYEGRVSVLDAAPKEAAPSQPTTLTPGRELVASTVAPVSRVAATDTSRSLSWESGQLVFIDEPLASAVERVNRYTRDKIEVGDRAAAIIPVTGIFRAGDTTAFLEGVSAVFPVRVATHAGRRSLVASGASKPEE